ncbi:MAG: glutathione S-transferase family protein [Alphaproteobacteria bacterium]
MLTLFASRSSLAQRCTILLEESALAFRARLQDPDRPSRALLRDKPPGRLPALVDHDGPFDRPVVLRQSIAIVLYLAKKTGRFVPGDPEEHARFLEWVMIIASDLYPAFTAHYWMNEMTPAPQAEAAEFWERRLARGFAELDDHLASHRFMAGDEYSAADIIAYPMTVMARRDFRAFAGQPLAGHRHLRRWMTAVGRRPAVRRGMTLAAQRRT